MDEPEQPAVVVLKKFFSDMRQWQISCIKGFEDRKNGIVSSDAFWKSIDDHLKGIFDQYCACTKKVFASGFSSVPTFDVDNPIIELSEKGDKVFVVIERISDSSNAKLRYTLLKKDNAYKVSDQVKIYDETKKKYVSFDMLL